MQEDSASARPSVLVLDANGSTLLAGGGGVYRSTNVGKTWVGAGFGGVGVWALCWSGSTLFAGTRDSGLFSSADSGRNWKETDNGISDVKSNTVSALTIFGQAIYAGTEASGMYRSTNNGSTWSQCNNGLTNMWVSTIVLNGATLFAGTHPSGIFRSSNNGANWIQVNAGLIDTDVYTLLVTGSTIYAGTVHGGVFVSTNNGDSWMQSNSGLTDLEVLALVVSGTTLYAGTFDGVFRADLSGSAVASNSLPASPLFVLSVHPNPTVSKLFVRYNFVANEEIDLYNVLGERVMNSRGNKSGEQIFDVGGLRTGMYVLSLRAGADRVRRTVMIAR